MTLESILTIITVVLALVTSAVSAAAVFFASRERIVKIEANIEWMRNELEKQEEINIRFEKRFEEWWQNKR